MPLSQTAPAASADAARSRLHITPQTILSRSPRTGAIIGEVEVATPLQIREAVGLARLAQPAWEGIGLRRRLTFLRSLRDALYRGQNRILDMLVAEQGKVRQEATLEYLACLELVDYTLRTAPRVLRQRDVRVRLLPHRRFTIERYPYGVVLVIAPWNYPLWLSLDPIVTGLAAGNTILYKPSEYASQLGEIVASLVAEADIPREVFHILHGYGDVGQALIAAHPDYIVFTGSAATGRKVAHAAAEQVIPVTLELGGKDAAIVLADADVEEVAEGIVWSGMFNAGQTCASVERVIVLRPVAERLIAAMKQAVMRYISNGDGTPSPMLAALTTPQQMEIVQQQVQEALATGARAIIGGRRLDGDGRFYAPTILVDVTPEMRIWQEETFGPVVAVMVADTEEEAIHLANASDYGLTASLWTRDPRRAEHLARQLKVGSVSINEHLLISGVPEMPWGGVKGSGYGRTHGEQGLQEMTCIRTLNSDRWALPLEPFRYPYTAFKRSLARRATHFLYGPTLIDRLRSLR